MIDSFVKDDGLPLVSIIIPVYNKVDFIRETLESVLEQSYSKTEIILVNDGSTDESLKILEEFKSKLFDKVILIDSPNLGVSAATNLGIEASNGDYIQFLDADDLISPNKISNQICILNGNGNQNIATCSYVGFKESIHNYSRIPYSVFQSFESGLDLLRKIWERQEMLQPACFLTSRFLIEKAGPWDESLIINQDGEFFTRVLLHAKQIIYDSNSIVYYRTPGPNNVSQQKSEKAFSSLLNSFQLYEKYTLVNEDSISVRKALKQVYQKFIYDCFPKYPGLISKAEELINNLGISEETYIGGPKFQMLSKCFGFKNALRLKRFLE